MFRKYIDIHRIVESGKIPGLLDYRARSIPKVISSRMIYTGMFYGRNHAALSLKLAYLPCSLALRCVSSVTTSACSAILICQQRSISAYGHQHTLLCNVPHSLLLPSTSTNPQYTFHRSARTEPCQSSCWSSAVRKRGRRNHGRRASQRLNMAGHTHEACLFGYCEALLPRILSRYVLTRNSLQYRTQLS